MSIVTIIPARSGSKSIPKKNIQHLNGKPLIEHSISYSLRCSLVNDTILSTDCEEISALGRQFGASVPFLRPKCYALDDSRDYDFMRHALDFLDNQDRVYDYYVLLRPTSPLRPAGLIERAVDILNKNSQASSVRSMARTDEHPYRCWTPLEGGNVAPFVSDIEESYNIPRQSLPVVLFQTGDIEVVRRHTLLNGSVSGKSVFPLILEHSDMMDIDHPTDLRAAEKLMIDKGSQ
jgi:CMP-N,N'-diacetyllegionaminic acid synthase